MRITSPKSTGTYKDSRVLTGSVSTSYRIRELLPITET